MHSFLDCNQRNEAAMNAIERQMNDSPKTGKDLYERTT